GEIQDLREPPSTEVRSTDTAKPNLPIGD
ncbi:BnaCnng68250D, partial [Brassica napus]